MQFWAFRWFIGELNVYAIARIKYIYFELLPVGYMKMQIRRDIISSNRALVLEIELVRNARVSSQQRATTSSFS